MAPRSASGAPKKTARAASVSKKTVFNQSSPMKRMKKTHLIDLFINEADAGVCTTLMDDIEGEILLEYVSVPGSTDKLLKCKEFAKRGTKRMVKWILKLNKAGWSFFGNITAQDFLVTPFRQIKVRAKKLDDLQPSTREGTKADMDAIASVITEMFSADKEDIPYSLKHLLKLLRNYKKMYALILEHHPVGMTEYEFLCLFNLLYMRVDVLKKENRSEYDEIIKRLPYCKAGKLHWMTQVMKQLYLKKILVYQKPIGGTKKTYTYGGVPVAYRPHGGDMLRLIRNGVQHLLKEESIFIMKFFRHKKSFLRRIILFRYYQLAHMIAETLPKVVCRLLKVMHRRGHFEELLR